MMSWVVSAVFGVLEKGRGVWGALGACGIMCVLEVALRMGLTVLVTTLEA